MKLKRYLIERSYDVSDIPRTFRVAFDLGYSVKDSEDVFKQLAKGKLEGMTGISDRGDIAFHWLGVGRDGLLIMNGKEVVKLNKISRFMYDNPHYFFSNNMAGLKRMWSKEGLKTSYTLRNFMEYLFKVLIQEKVFTVGEVQYMAPYQDLMFTSKADTVKINSVKDFIKWFRSAYKERSEKKPDFKRYYFDKLDAISDGQYMRYIEKVFTVWISKIYGGEGEWLIKNKTLKIPSSSSIYILRYKGSVFDKSRTEHNEAIDKWISKLGLERKYRIKFIDPKEWERVRGIHFTNK